MSEGGRAGHGISLPPEQAAVARRMLSYLRPHRGRLIALGLSSVVATLVGLAPALLVKALVDDLERRHTSFGHVAELIGAGGALLVAGGLIGVVATWLTLVIKTDVMAELRQALTNRLVSQSVKYFTENRGGELMSRVLNDVTATQDMLESGLNAATNAVAVLGCIVAMFVLEWQLALLTIAIVPVVVLALRLGRRPVWRTRMELQKRWAELTAHLQERLSLSGIMLIKSFGREDTETEAIEELNQGLRQSQLRAGMTARWLGMVFALLQFVAPATLLLVGGWLVIDGNTSLGALIAFITVLGLRFGASISGLGNGALGVLGALPACRRIFDVIDQPAEVEQRPGALELLDPKGAVRLEAVTFSYPARSQPALAEISLEISPGQLVALVGPSGAGKSTLSALVPRFYDPQFGAVRIDGHDVRDLTLATLGRVVGIVLQETYLLHGSLRRNLLYARPDATPEELENACAAAQLRAVVEALPEGLDTIVGERGHRLSGGERQRVAIARVILKDPPILILDEATSHLDSVSEQLVQNALNQLFVGRTSLVIAHRLSTVLAADMIVVLDRGRIVQRGTHAELLESDKLYRSLYETQFRTHHSEPAPPSAEPSSRATTQLMAALRFLRAAREDPSIRERLERLDPARGLEPVVNIAATAGFTVSVESLRAAHAHDWAFRSARYAPRSLE